MVGGLACRAWRERRGVEAGRPLGTERGVAHAQLAAVPSPPGGPSALPLIPALLMTLAG